MTKIGNKGFMMAEVVVVSVIVAVTLVALYTSVNRITTAFNTRNRYYDLDCLNLAIAVNDTLTSNGVVNNIISDTNSENIDDHFQGMGNIINLYDDYNEVNIYFVKNNNNTIDINQIGDIKPSTSNYFNYLEKNLSDIYNYYIVSEICKETKDSCYYYGLGVK